LVFRQDVVEERLKELDVVLDELSKYKDKTIQDLESSLSARWVVERGLIAGAGLIFDIADHILSSHFGLYPDSYEDSLEMLSKNSIVSGALFDDIKGLGGFRNILVHEYLKVDVEELYKNYQKALSVFPRFSMEILEWTKKAQQV
jgi:uncharacterized protein YutE (UPF0331/DUF86 family)